MSVVRRNLVPIRLNVSIDDKELADYFLWNIDNEDMTAEQFARQTCLDCDMPVAFEEKITSSIHWHVSRAHAIAKCPEAHHKTLTVHLDMTFNGLTLKDNLLWSTEAVLRDEPEEFAKQTVEELSLSDAFLQPIAFAIREQVFLYQLMFLDDKEGVKVPSTSVSKELLRTDEDKLEWGPLLLPAATAKLIPGSTLINCSTTQFRDLGTVTSNLQ